MENEKNRAPSLPTDDLHVFTDSDYLLRNLIYSSIELNEQLAMELSKLNELRDSRISDRVIMLAGATVKITELAFLKAADIDAVIKNFER